MTDSEHSWSYVSGNIHVQFYDADSDGLDDLFVCDKDGDIVYFRNYGTSSAPVYKEDSTRNPLMDVSVIGAPRLHLVDTKGTGVKDAIVTSVLGAVNFFQNLGKTTVPSFVKVTGSSNIWYNVDAGVDICMEVWDVNNDGLKDMVMGQAGGTITYYKNTGSLTAAAFTLQSGTSDPWNGVTFGSYPCPRFFDVDNDGKSKFFSFASQIQRQRSLTTSLNSPPPLLSTHLQRTW